MSVAAEPSPPGAPPGNPDLPWAQRLAWRGGAEISGRALRVVATWVWAQHLSTEAFGRVAHAWALSLLVAQVSNAGLPQWLLREVTAKPLATRALVSQALTWRWLLLVPQLAAFAGIGALGGEPGSTVYLLLLVAATLSAFHDIVGHVLMGLGRWNVEAGATLATGLTVALSTLAAMALGWGADGAAWSALVGSAVGLLLALVALRRALPKAEAPRAKLPVRQLAPWAVLVALYLISYQQDVLWLEWLVSTTAVAHFAAVFRIVGLSAPALRVADQLLLSLATRLSAQADPVGRLGVVTRSGLWLGTIVGVLAAAVLALSLPVVLPMLYPFADAETNRVARWLAWLLVPWFANVSLTQVALARGRSVMIMLWTGLCLLVHAGLCAWLVPAAGAPGAAAAKTIAGFFGTASLAWLMRRELHATPP